tara:strand:+ start:934 stop:1197 length:264 start_codon:yes stop_codon:yes gene_type:complete
MKKFFVILSILLLILSTAFIKNSTKKIEDEIFSKNENLRRLNKEFEKTKLEFDFLSSAEKLIEYKNLYFENELVPKDLKKIEKLNNN